MKVIGSRIEVSVETQIKQTLDVTYLLYLKNGDSLEDSYSWDIYRRIDENA